MILVDQKKKKFWVLLAILSVTFIVFSPALGNRFTNWDDGVLLVENNEIHDFSLGTLQRIFSKNYVGTYIPLTILSFNFENFFFQNQTVFYFLDNLLLHLGVVALIFLLAQRVGLSLAASGLSALLFGIHPMHVESVAWISQRKDVLYSVFYLLAVLFYWDFIKSKKSICYWTALLFGLLSILSKPMAYSLPFVLFLCDWLSQRKIDGRAISEKLLFLLLIGCISFITYTSNPHTTTFNIGQAVLVWIWVFIFHIQKFFFPSFLIAAYRLPYPVSLGNPQYLAAVIAFLIFVAGVFLLRRQKWIWMAVLFYFLSDSMIIFRAAWEFGNNTVVADRFMYLPSLGFCLACGVLGEALYKYFRKNWYYAQIVKISCLCILGGMMLMSWKQTGVWKDNIALWSHDIKYDPNNFFAYQNRAAGYTEEHRYELAMSDLDKAMRFGVQKAVLYYCRADLYEKMGELHKALDDLNVSSELNPDDAKIYFLRGKIYQALGSTPQALRDYGIAIDNQPDMDRAFYNRGILFDEMQKSNLALADYAEVIRINPFHPKVYNNRAVIYIGLGEYNKAEEDLRKAVKIDRHNAQAYANLGAVAFARREYLKAVSFFDKSIALDPCFSQAYVNRAVLYALEGKNEFAQANLDRALVLDPKNANAYFTRALLNYNLGKSQLALKDVQKALVVDPNNIKAQNLKSQITH